VAIFSQVALRAANVSVGRLSDCTWALVDALRSHDQQMHLTQITNSSHCSFHQESRAMQSMGEKWDTSSASSILEIAGAAVPAVPCRWVWMQCHWCGVLQIGVDAVPAPSSDGCGCSASGILQMGVDAVPVVSWRRLW